MSNRLGSVSVAALVVAVFAAASFAARPSVRSGAPPRADVELIHLGAESDGTNAFVAWPLVRPKASALVLVHENWGLNGQIRDVARRLSREGYVVIVPDLYHGRLATEPDKAREMARALDRDAALTDLRAAVAWLRSRPETEKSRIAAMGFGMGGRLALELGLEGADLSAIVMFYGEPATDAERFEKLRAPVQAHFGAADEAPPVYRADQLRDALASAGKPGHVFVYPGAGHAFMNENRTSYRPDAMRQAWARTLAFLQKQLRT